MPLTIIKGLLEKTQSASVLGLQQVIDAMPHLVWLASAKKGCEFVSCRWEEYAGVPANELLGYQWAQLIHADDRERIEGVWRRAIETGVEFHSTCRLRNRHGDYRWFENRAAPLHNAQGEVIIWFGTNTDVQEVYAARDALKVNEERLRYVEQATHDAVYDWDALTGVIRRNEAFQTRFAGAASMNMADGWWQSRVHPDDLARVVASAEAAFGLCQSTWQEEYRMLLADGTYATVVDRGYLLYDANRQPSRMIGAITDITASKVVEQSLRDAQARLLSALEGGGMATWIWDIPTDSLVWDEAAYRLWGRAYDLQPLTLTRTVDFIHSEDRAGIEAAVAEFFRTGVQKIVEFRTLRPDGAPQWLQIRGRVERDETGKPMRMAGVYIDVTERKRNEEMQLRSQKMEALGTLAGGIAHDFNNILLAIAGNANLAIEEIKTALPSEHPVQRSLEEIGKASIRAADLVRRILSFSRQQESKREVVRLRPLIEEALRLLRPTLPAAVEIRTTFAQDAPAAAVDAIQIHQVIMNLVTNAAHAIGDRCGVIEILLAKESVTDDLARGLEGLPPGDYACIAVRDTGVGIDRDIVSRIFDPFFTTKQMGQGTGLGLAVVHGIVKEHGGAIAVQTELGKGTEFRVYFPDGGIDFTATSAIAIAPQRSQGERVLYVDDEESLVFLISRTLDRLGYRVTGCVDPLQAIELVKQCPQAFDVVVTDLSMRGMNGFELTRALLAIRGDLPIVMTSGYVRTEDRETAEQLGIRDLILKPNTVAELGLSLDRILEALR